MTRADLQRLVDELPEESIDSTAVVLDRVRDPFWGALLASRPDDEPFTAESRSAVEAARHRPGIFVGGAPGRPRPRQTAAGADRSTAAS